MKDAFRIVFYFGWKQELVIIALVLLTGVVEGVGIASLWPIVGLVSGGSGMTGHAMGNPIVASLEGLGLPVSFEVLLALVAIISVVRFALGLAASIFIGRSIATTSTGLNLRLVDAAVHAKWSYFISQPNARFTNAIGPDSIRGSAAYSACLNLVAASVRALAYLLMALWVSWQFFLAGIAVAVILWLGVNGFMKMARKAGRTKTKQTLLLNKTITDTLTNIKALKAMNRQGFIAQSFRHHVDALRNALAAESYSESMVRAIQEPIFFVFIMGGIYLQHTLLNMSIQQILGSILVLRGLAGAIGTIRSSMQRVLIDSSAFWSLVGLIEELDGVAEQLHGGTAPRFDAGISFDRVNFGYGEKRILTDASIEMPPHAVTSVIGPSGAGKTTIADLLVGLNKPESGRVLVAGVDLETIDTVAWRKQIGYIPQDTVLFNQSIAKNVTLGDESIDPDKVIAALKAADAWDFVQALPGGVDYVVGVRGSLLSGGQRQRLSIARALCNTPQLLILDEATSALDRETAIEIANGIRNLVGEKTVFAISHQSIWVDAADRVYEMQKGTLKAADAQPPQ